MEESEESEGGCEAERPGCDTPEIAIPVWDVGIVAAITFLTGSTRAPESLGPDPLRCSLGTPSPLLPLAPPTAETIGASEVPDDKSVTLLHKNT